MSEVKYYFGIPFEVRGSAAAPAATEPKFKVGDRVRILVDDELEAFKAGDVVVLTKVDWPLVEFIDREGDPRLRRHDKFELAAPTFTKGQRVRLKRNTDYYAVGDAGTVETISDRIGVIMDRSHVYALFEPDWLEAGADDCVERKEQRDNVIKIELDTTDLDEALDKLRNMTSSCIVALVKNGQPRPADRPYVHSDSAAALLEAERLAKNNPGQEFAVYQRVGARVAEVSYEMKEVA